MTELRNVALILLCAIASSLAQTPQRQRARPRLYGEVVGRGRITSAVPGLALAYVRVEVPEDAELTVAGAPARLHWPPERP